MRRIAVRTVLCFPAIGLCILACNAILGNESAVFDPAAADSAIDGAIGEDGASSDASDAGSSDADATTPCIDTTSDPKHCGTCGHDCLGGACIKGRCQPFVLVSEPGSITALAVDPTHLYWSNSKTGDVKRRPLAGGAEQVIFDGPNDTDLGDALVRVGSDVYFPVNAANGGVYRCPITGCVGTVGGVDQIFGDVPNVRHIAVEPGGRFTFAEGKAGGRVVQCTPPCSVGTNVLANTEGFPRFVAVGSDGTYWSTLQPNLGNLRAKPVAQQPQTIAASYPVREIVLIPDAVVFADLGAGPTIVQRDGGAFRRVGPNNDGLNNDHVAVDDGVVYFNDAFGGRILKCPLSGCDGGAEEVAPAQAKPYAIAVTSSAIFWTNLGAGTTSVMRLVK